MQSCAFVNRFGLTVVFAWMCLSVQGVLAVGVATNSPLSVATVLGGPGDNDAVVGVRIQSDGSVVVAANLAQGTRIADRVVKGTPVDGTVGVVLRLTSDGKQVLSLLPIAAKLHDLAIDDADRIYLAAGAAGLAVVDKAGVKGIRARELGASCTRVDVTGDGHAAALAGGKATLFSPDGRAMTQVSGKSYTEDVAVHGPSKTIVLTGFTNNNAFDGNRTYPVQICYVWGYGYDGKRKYTLYDWSVDRDSDRFLNKPTNNMADTRGYRCAIGDDGKLYVAFEAAGGNHLFRYSTTDITTPFKLVGGDQYHRFHQSRSEHKIVFGRFDAATGEAIAIQEFCTRLADGNANATRIKDGDIAADSEGRVYLAGASAHGLPVSETLENSGDYKGGAFVLIMSPDLTERIFCTYTGGREMHTIAFRRADGKNLLAFGGRGPEDGKPVHLYQPLQEKRFGTDGYLAIGVLR